MSKITNKDPWMIFDKGYINRDKIQYIEKGMGIGLWQITINDKYTGYFHSEVEMENIFKDLTSFNI